MLINYSLYSMGELEVSLGVERFRRVGRGLELTERCRCAGLRQARHAPHPARLATSREFRKQPV
jgi:hypothetical protein